MGTLIKYGLEEFNKKYKNIIKNNNINENNNKNNDINNNKINIDKLNNQQILNTNKFDTFGNTPIRNWSVNQKRGGEDYIPPIGWDGYELKVKGKYDNGDDTWLEGRDKKGEYSIAYFGLSNVHVKNKTFEQLLEYDFQKLFKKCSQQTYQNDNDMRNPGNICGSGVYLFQDPTIAENAAEIVDLGGLKYKLLLMCRVNPKKIRQPEGFKKCWILNPSDYEIRPYRILLKYISIINLWHLLTKMK